MTLRSFWRKKKSKHIILLLVLCVFCYRIILLKFIAPWSDYYSKTPFFFFQLKTFFFWLCWVFVIALRGLSLVTVSRAALCCSTQASHYSGFSCCRAQALGMWVSVVSARGVRSRGSVLWCTDLVAHLWPGIKPMPPALAGRFSCLHHLGSLKSHSSQRLYGIIICSYSWGSDKELIFLNLGNLSFNQCHKNSVP